MAKCMFSVQEDYKLHLTKLACLRNFVQRSVGSSQLLLVRPFTDVGDNFNTGV